MTSDMITHAMPIAKQDLPKPGQSYKPNKASPNWTSVEVWRRLPFSLSFRLLITPLSFSPSLHPTSLCFRALFLASFRCPFCWLFTSSIFLFFSLFLSTLPSFRVGDEDTTPKWGQIAKRDKERVRVTRQENNTNPIRAITRRQGSNSRTRQARKRQSKQPNQRPQKQTHQGNEPHCHTWSKQKLMSLINKMKPTNPNANTFEKLHMSKWHSCRTLLWDTLVGHSSRKLLWDTLLGHSCGTL